MLVTIITTLQPHLLHISYRGECEISMTMQERMDSYVEGSELPRPSRCPRHNRGLSALWLGSKWVTLLDITQLLHNDPTVLLLLQHARWLSMKVMARRIWTVYLLLSTREHAHI